MRKLTIRAVITSTILLANCSSSQSEDLSLPALLKKSGNAFKQGCSEFVAGNYTPAAMKCFARVETFFDAIQSYKLPSSQTRICKSDDINYGDLVRAINSNSYKVPSTYGAFAVLQTAAQLAYPCSSGSR